MNEIILKLLNKFSTLTPPINPLIIKELFNESPLKEGFHSPEFNEHFELLNRLKQLSQDFFDSNAKLEVLNSRRKNFISLNRKKEELSAKNNELKVSIEQLNQKLLNICRQIEAKVNGTLSNAPLATVFNHSQYQAMKLMVFDRLSELDTACKEIDTRRAKSKLVLLLNMFNRLDAELKAADIGYSDDTNEEQVLEIAKTVRAESNQLENHYKTAEALQRVFAQQLSIEDLQLKSGEFDTQNTELTVHQELLSTQICSFELDEPIKIRLTQEFNDNPDKKNLIESYRRKIDSVWDFVNPLAWTAWGFEAITFNLDKQKHDQEQAVLKLSSEFLELLNKQLLNQDQQKDIFANKKLLEQVMPKPRLNIDNPDHNEVTTSSRRLIKDTIKLFSALQSFVSIIELQDDSSETDFYLTLLLNMPLISDKLEKKRVISSKLADLIRLYGAIEQLRTENGLLADQDSLLPNLQSAEQESKTLAEQAPLRNDYQDQLRLCKIYESYAQELDALTINMAQNRAKLKQLQADLRLPANKAPKSQEIASLHNHLSTISDTITLKFNQLHQLAILTLNRKAISEAAETEIHTEVNDTASEPIRAELFTSQQSIITDITLQKSSASETLPVLVLEETPLIEEQKKQDSSEEELLSTEEFLDDSGFDDLPQFNDNNYFDQTLINPEATSESNTPVHYSSEEELYSLSEELTSEHVDESSEQSDDSSFYEQGPAPLSSPVSVYPPIVLATASKPLINTKITVDLLPSEHASPTSEHSSSDSPIAEPLVSTMNNINLLVTTPDPIKSTNHFYADNLVTSSLSENTSSLSEDEQYTEHYDLLSIQRNFDNVQKWHNEIKSYILKHDEDIQQWYKGVYLALKNPLTNESSCYKAAHLIRDVLFELEHRKNSDVIRTYIRLCPNPVQDIHKLLAIKPSLLITETPVDDAELLIDCPSQLKNHYRHYNKLKSTYPIEAELFLQAIRSVHMIQLYAELPNHKLIPDQVPSLASDPRYASLKRHRGFLQVWEMLEDLWRLIVGKITGQHEYEYSKRPCFFNTKSNQLIQEADTMIQDLLPGHTV